MAQRPACPPVYAQTSRTMRRWWRGPGRPIRRIGEANSDSHARRLGKRRKKLEAAIRKLEQEIGPFHCPHLPAKASLSDSGQSNRRKLSERDGREWDQIAL